MPRRRAEPHCSRPARSKAGEVESRAGTQTRMEMGADSRRCALSGSAPGDEVVLADSFVDEQKLRRPSVVATVRRSLLRFLASPARFQLVFALGVVAEVL